MTNLVLLAGIPGAGKSTWAKTLLALKYAIISSDEIRERVAGSLRAAHDQGLKPWDIFYREIEDRLVHNVDVVADATFLTCRHRIRARELADKTNSSLHLILFANWWEAALRNDARDPESQVPPEAMDGMMTLYWETVNAITNERYDTVTEIRSFH